MSIYIDGEEKFRNPVEIEGSGVRVFEPFDNISFSVTRNFVQLRNAYQPMALTTADYQYRNAFLVDERENQRAAGLVWFTRVFATLPPTRFEKELTAYSFPGESQFLSTLNADGSVTRSWNPYGRKRPGTVYRNATVTISYSIGPVTTELPTQILFAGSPVDFVGSVMTSDGQQLLGYTVPSFAPNTYIVSDTCERWKGNLWERRKKVVTLA